MNLSANKNDSSLSVQKSREFASEHQKQDEQNIEPLEDKNQSNYEGYSTPASVHSRISSKRVCKAFEKSELRLKNQLARNQGIPQSRGTMPRFGAERYGPYGVEMGMH